MPDINKMAPRSGRILKEDGTVINIADAGLPVKLTGSIGEDARVYRVTGIMAESETKEVFRAELGEASVIDFLEFTTNSASNVNIKIYVNNTSGSASVIPLLLADGSGITGMTPYRLIREGNAFFDVLVYDLDNLKFKLTLKRPIYLPYGGRVEISNTSSSQTFTAGATVVVRKL